jgi:hypothetical protein
MKAYEAGENEIRLTVHTGAVLNLRELALDDIRIEDIAHSLAHTCRFAGHCPTFYTVAQHSVTVSEMVPAEHALAALLHDGSEAYLGDVTHFLKHAPELAGYRAIEAQVQALIFERFGCPREMHEKIKLADRTLTDLEWRQMMMREQFACFAPIIPVGFHTARQAFLRRFVELMAARGQRALVNYESIRPHRPRDERGRLSPQRLPSRRLLQADADHEDERRVRRSGCRPRARTRSGIPGTVERIRIMRLFAVLFSYALDGAPEVVSLGVRETLKQYQAVEQAGRAFHWRSTFSKKHDAGIIHHTPDAAISAAITQAEDELEHARKAVADAELKLNSLFELKAKHTS